MRTPISLSRDNDCDQRDFTTRVQARVPSGHSPAQVDPAAVDSSSYDAARYGARRCLLVLGDNEPEVVDAAGGLIYDFSSAGWDVIAKMASPGDDRPMRILGATTAPLSHLDNFQTGARWPAAVIVSPIIFRQDMSVRDFFTRALLRTGAAVAMWGDDWPSRLGTDIGKLSHQLSPAARAFKLQAKLASEKPVGVSGCAEIFHGSMQKCASLSFGAASLLPI